MSLETQIKENIEKASSLICEIDSQIEEKKTRREKMFQSSIRCIGYLLRQAVLGTVISISAFSTYYFLSEHFGINKESSEEFSQKNSTHNSSSSLPDPNTLFSYQSEQKQGYRR